MHIRGSHIHPPRYKEFLYWGHLGEMERAPQHHGNSNLRPYEILDDYMLDESREIYGLPLPSSWTTFSGHIRDKTNNLCLGMDKSGAGATSVASLGLYLKRCSAEDEVQWLYGSDLNAYTKETQIKLANINSYASVDPFTPSPTQAPTPAPPWREDSRCGPKLCELADIGSFGCEVVGDFMFPDESGTPAQCRPTSDYPEGTPESAIKPCCNTAQGVCGGGGGSGNTYHMYCTCGDPEAPGYDAIAAKQCCGEGKPPDCYSQVGEYAPGRRLDPTTQFGDVLADALAAPTPAPIPYTSTSRDLGSSREPGISINSLTSPIGLCVNGWGTGGNTGKKLNVDLCTSNPMQGWYQDDEGVMYNEHFSTNGVAHCLVYQGTPEIGTEIALRRCDDTAYTPLKWSMPNGEVMDASVIPVENLATENVDVITQNAPCSFLTAPQSSNWWPVADKTDVHKHCLKFHAKLGTGAANNYGESSVTYDVGALGDFSRFQTFVGIADMGVKPAGQVEFKIYTDGDLVATINCGATTMDFGTKDGFETTVVRNMCSFSDCDPDTVEDLAGNDKVCLMPYQPVDVVIADITELKLVIRTSPSCRTRRFTDREGVEHEEGCDGNLYAAWGSPTFANAVNGGEESQLQYTVRMLWGMHASIFEPCWVMFIAMDICILLIDMTCLVLVFWGCWYWAAYKRSRQKMFTAWALTFVGPLVISCVPIRLFIPWDRADSHIDSYLVDFERRYNLETVEDIVLESCKTLVNGYGDAGIDSMVASVVGLCAKKDSVPVNCDVYDVNAEQNVNPYEEDGEDPLDNCYPYWKEQFNPDPTGTLVGSGKGIGGALQWAQVVDLPATPDVVFADLMFTSPAGELFTGFPSTCFDIFKQGLIPSACSADSGFPWPEDTNPKLPCTCTENCEIGGSCTMENGDETVSVVMCTDLYSYMNCSDVDLYYHDNCDCQCVVKAEPFAETPSGQPLWLETSEFCIDGMVDQAIPKIKYDKTWVPFKGWVEVNTFPTHVKCGMARGYLFEAKFDAAVDAVREACRGLIDTYDSSEVSLMDRVMQGIEDLLEYAKQMAGITASLYNAFVMFHLALPVALCIGPALLRGALRTKLLVPQSATPGLFIQLLPWLYCPIVWCLYNFVFQLMGNIWLLPGLLLLAYIPMTYFVVGVRQELSKPMTKQAINLVIYWLDVFNLLASLVAYALIGYGMYFTMYLDPNSKMMSLLVNDSVKKGDPIKAVSLFVFVFVKILFKYTCTTVTGVDFMMYELIQQRFYEMFLEKGDDTAVVLQEARANRLDAFCKLVASSMKDDMKRSKTDKGGGKDDRRKSKMEKGRKSTISSRKSTSSSRSSMGSTGSMSRGSLGRESSFASTIMDNSNQSTTSHLVGPASIKQIMAKKASIWDLINNGQPRLKNLPQNTINAIICTPLHLKRSRSKLEIAKKMASRAEVAYLSTKLGLAHTNDSAICYELMVWRRSSLWTLIGFGSLATFFALAQINVDYQNAHAFYDLATQGTLHRFPELGYLENYTLDHFGLDDPSIWTKFSGPLSTNVTDPTTGRTETRYLDVVGNAGSISAHLGLVRRYEYDDSNLQWSYEPVNGTVRSEGGLCMDGDHRMGTNVKETSVGGHLVGNSCINDFLRNVEGKDLSNDPTMTKEELNAREPVSLIRESQVWKFWPDPLNPRVGVLRTGAYCVAHYSQPIDKVLPVEVVDGENVHRCGTAYPLETGDPSQCDGLDGDHKCCLNGYSTGSSIFGFLDSIAGRCGSSVLYCPDETNPAACSDSRCTDYSLEKNRNIELSNIPLTLTICDNKSLETGIGLKPNVVKFNLPDQQNVAERLHSWCNDVNNCRWANATTLSAQFDYGSLYFAGNSDARWRCYADEAMITTTVDDSFGAYTKKTYNLDKLSRRYCDAHESITAIKAVAQGREPFDTYSNRMMKTGYARMMTEAESAMISINALLILLAWAAILLATLAFHLYSRYKLSRTLVMLGWFCTFLAPFLLSMIPLRLFIRWQESVPVQDALLNEFRDHYGLVSKEQALIDTCRAFEEDNKIEDLIDLTLGLCAYHLEVPAVVAHQWGDVEMGEAALNTYACAAKYATETSIEAGNSWHNGQMNGAVGTGYPAVMKNPCEALDAANGAAAYDKGSFVCDTATQTDENGNVVSKCDCPEGTTQEEMDAEADCKASQDFDIGVLKEMCERDAAPSFPPFQTNGYIPLLMMGSTAYNEETGESVASPSTFNGDLAWPASVWISDVAFDVNELHVQCGQARRHICLGDYEEGVAAAKAVCAEISNYLDDEEGGDAQNIEETVELLMLSLKEVTEIGISLVHSIKSFKIMSSATFALAPALIRAAIRVKTAVPQNTISGMFVIVLPWLYSPLVWCVYNLVFQVIGNWQLLIGLLIMAYGPVMFFVIAIMKDITRPMPDKEIHVIRLMLTIAGRVKVVFGCIFVTWGLYVYTFQEQEAYTSGYKDYLMADFTTLSFLELAANIVMKYYYTTIVGVDYMLSQILSSRRYEVYMQMAGQNSMWSKSKAAQRAADLKDHYVHLMNNFCHMAGLSTADLPEFAHYRAHKINKAKKEAAKIKRKEASERNLMGGGEEKKRGFFHMNTAFFSRPPDRSEGVPEIEPEVEMSNFTHVNPLASGDKVRKSEAQVGALAKPTNEDWVVSTDPASGKAYKYNSKTGETEWIEEQEENGEANGLEDDVIIAMLKKSPKEVAQMHSRDAFRKFFRGMQADRVDRLLREANKDKSSDEIEVKVKKRMKLLDGVLS